MIRPRALDHDLRQLFRAWPLGVGCDIAYGLCDKRLIASLGSLAKVPSAPSQNFTDILKSGEGIEFESMNDFDAFLDQIGEEVSAEIAAERKRG